MARHAPLETILCDDQNILRRKGNAIIVHSTPWGLYTQGSRQAPLGGMFLLEQAERFELTPLNPLAVFEFLWNEHKDNRALLPRSDQVRAFTFFSDVSKSAPAYRMRFPRDRIDWAAIDAALASHA